MDCGHGHQRAVGNLDGDGTAGVVLACEWGSLRAFRATRRRSPRSPTAAGLDKHTRLVERPRGCGLDHDGDMDCGNEFRPEHEIQTEPRRSRSALFGGFDDSGNSHIVEAKFEGDILRPRRGLSCSSTAMPFIKEKRRRSTPSPPLR